MPRNNSSTQSVKNPSQLSVYRIIKAHAERNPEALAISAPGRPSLSYRGLRIFIDEVVRTLNSMGIGQGDRVGIVLPNGPDMAAAFLAVASGATCAPLNPAYRAEDFEFYLSDLEAKAVIVQSGIDSPARTVVQSRGIPIVELTPSLQSEAGVFALSDGRPSRPARGGFAQADDVALVLHTSGTTSRPKMVPLTQANVCTSAENIRVALGLSESDRCLNVMPLFHIHGLIGALLSSIAAGASIVCSSGFDSIKFFHWMKEYRPTWYSAVPTMHQSILGLAETHREVIEQSPLRFIRSSSASLPVKVMTALEDVFGVLVIESYGMTEASHQMTSNPLPPLERKPGSVGVAAGPEVAIMDDVGNFLKAGETGEIVIRGANVTRGYENNPTANESAFVNGWFRTGDQGCLDSDNYLFIKGRLKEIINRGGEKISPQEVDEAIMEHPAVDQAVTFAVPHPTLGEDIAVAVVPRKGSTVREREIREFAFGRLADFKVPSQVVIVDEIPKGATGKLQRIGLAEKLSHKLKPEFVSPRNPAENNLAIIWSEVLGMKKVGVYDNFFMLGGDSISATRVVSRIRAVFQVELPLESIFRQPTIADQAIVIEEIIITEIEQLSEEEARRLADEMR